MIGFLKYMWNEYKKQKKLKELNDKCNEMVKDSKKLSGSEMKLKYGDVSRIFTNLRWESIKIKRGK